MRLTAKSEWPKFRERTGLEKGSRETSRPAKDPLVSLWGRSTPQSLSKSSNTQEYNSKAQSSTGKGALRN